ncbi:MAG: hypothetical protein HY548_01650 [Elusimicrobia bacterium]|nr:hypothetical protein [Elusimicrobiota bacterium]
MDFTVDAGRRSAAEDFEEEDFDSQYVYRNTRLKVQRNETPRARYGFSTFRGEKDYKTENVYNNQINHTQANLSLDTRPGKREASRWGMDLDYQTKRYDRSTPGDYNRVAAAPFFTQAVEDRYRYTLAAGLNRYDYLDSPSKDQNAYFVKAEGSRHLWGPRLTLLSFLKTTVEENRRALREKTKTEFMAKTDYRMERRLIRRAELRVNLGQKDTKEDGERDIDYDYRFWAAQAATHHDIDTRTDMDFTVEAVRKNYLGSYPGHNSRRIRNVWKRTLITNERARWWISSAVELKQVNFEARMDDYLRQSLELNTVYWRKEEWKSSLTLEARRYNYRAGRGKTRHYAALSFEKDYLGGKVTAAADVRYRFTTHGGQNDSEQKSVKLGVGYRL